MKINKKVLLLVAGLIILIGFGWWFYTQRSAPEKSGTDIPGNQTATLNPVFMSSEEKASLYISEETRVQVLNRDEKGEAITYKIINNDSEVITESQMAPIRPENQ